MRAAALEEFSGFDRNRLDVAIAAWLAVDQNFELSAARIRHVSVPLLIDYRVTYATHHSHLTTKATIKRMVAALRMYAPLR